MLLSGVGYTRDCFPFQPCRILQVMSNKPLMHWKSFWQDERATGLTEYALLLAFVMFVTIGLAHNFFGSVSGIVGVTHANLAAANGVVTGR